MIILFFISELFSYGNIYLWVEEDNVMIKQKKKKRKPKMSQKCEKKSGNVKAW